ncbi:MAG: HAMP domain-containing sensor histidine kinase [Eubacteriales bacterium]|nr:HAMP domain-containing sensor histidine kinase [Eubacteriales bacterium]
MKLFTKIFVRVFAGVLLLSATTFGYFLYEFQKQSLEAVRQYECVDFQRNIREFNRTFEQQNAHGEKKEIQNLIAENIFRSLIGSYGCLFRNGEEIANYSAYEFDYGELQRLAENDNSDNFGDFGELILPIQTVGGRKLLILCSEMQFNEKSDVYEILYYKDVTDVYERSRSLFIKGIVFCVFMLALIGGFLFLGIYKAIRPLVELKEAAASIAGGNYHIRVSAKGKDEITELAVSFNQMAERVEEHVEKLSRTNESQRRLLGSLAHELKTPMTAIIGYADTLLTVRLSDRRREQALQYIGNECRRLSGLSAKMMELTGLYEGEKTITFSEIRVAELFQRLKGLTAYRLKEKEITLITECTPESLVKRAEPDLLMSLLMNLVDNGFKASDNGAKIYVRGDENGIYVEDSGKGIPKEELSRVTEAFYMVDKSRSRSTGSAGLGLALCEQIAKLHGARLIIESEEGKGTRVSVLW